VNRLKPYFVPKSAVVTSPDFFPAQHSATPPPSLKPSDPQEKFFPPEDEEIYFLDDSPAMEATHPDPTHPSKPPAAVQT
jgi:hypothetical protein